MKLPDNVHCLKGKVSNIYLLDGEDVIVVDSGCCSEDGNMAVNYLLQEMGRPADAIKLIVLTHGHPDHSGGASFIARASGAAVAKWPSRGSEIREWTQIVRRVFTRQHFQMFLRMYQRAGNNFIPRRTSLGKTQQLDDGDILAGSTQWLVLHTPGHSYDSICLYNKSTRSLISGDTIVTIGGIPKLSSVRVSPELFDASVDRIAKLHIENLFPGHGKPVSSKELDHLLGKKRGA